MLGPLSVRPRLWPGTAFTVGGGLSAARPGAPAGEAIYEAFALRRSPAQRAMLGWVGALVATVLGAGLLVATLVSADDPSDRTAAVFLVLVALAASQALGRLRTPLPMWALDAMQLSTVAGLGLLGAGGGALHTLLPAIYVVMGTSFFVIRPLTTSLGHLAAIGASYAYVLVVGPDAQVPVARWVAVIGAVLIAGQFVRWLVDQVIDLATADHAARRDAETSTRALEQASAAKSAFLSRMSHELRTPLNVVLGFADVLRDQMIGPMNERQLAYVEDIATSGRDLLALVDDALDVSRVESGAIGLDRTLVDVEQAVADSELLLREQAAAAGVTVDLHAVGGPATAIADDRRLRQVAWNLLGNALKYSPPGATVRVRIRTDHDVVEVSVTDEGAGIAADDQARIFEQFEQGADAAAGTGLGLPLSRRIVEAHGGRLDVDSTVGRGSVFSFTVPRRPTAAPPPAPGPAADGPATGAAWDGDAFTVPDSAANRALIAQAARSFSMSAAALLLVLAAVTPGRADARAGVAAAAAAVVVASHRWRAGRTWPGGRASGLLLTAAAGVIIAGCVLIVGPFADLVPLAFGWRVLVAAALLTSARTAVEIAVVAVCYGFVLLIDPPGEVASRWIAIVMLVTAHAALIGWIATQLRHAIVESLRSRIAAEDARAKVEAASTHKADFLAHTSHELCTPLTAIIGFAEVLRDGMAGPLAPKQAEAVEDIIDSGRQLLGLITELLELARLEAGHLPNDRQPVTAASLVENVLAELAPIAWRRSVQLESDVADGLPPIDVDPAQLHHALTNLVANGIKFTPDGGRVAVLARAGDGHVLLSVRDTGIGIEPDQRNRVFEAFHQTNRPLPSHAQGGTGLGLALAKGLVELQGGELAFDSTPHVGSTFTIALPA